MQETLTTIMTAAKRYNCGELVHAVFGFSLEKHYDLLVIAPSWKPEKLWKNGSAAITLLHESGVNAGWEVRLGDRLIAWARTGCGACNVIDHLLICSDLNFDKVLFLGAAGGLKKGIEIGDICTPSVCTEGTMAPAYLLKDPRKFVPFSEVVPGDTRFIERIIAGAAARQIRVRRASVFCTDSISCEYCHLDFIKSFGTELIEMETSAFYRVAALLEKPAAALLAVSDNSANGDPLLGRSARQQQSYDTSRQIHLPRLISMIADMI